MCHYKIRSETPHVNLSISLQPAGQRRGREIWGSRTGVFFLSFIQYFVPLKKKTTLLSKKDVRIKIGFFF